MVHQKRLIPSHLCTKTHLRASVIQKIFRGLYPRTPMAGGGFGAPSRTHPPRGRRPRAGALCAPGSAVTNRDPPRFLTDRRPCERFCGQHGGWPLCGLPNEWPAPGGHCRLAGQLCIYKLSARKGSDRIGTRTTYVEVL
jgi:hypothetical protein